MRTDPNPNPPAPARPPRQRLDALESIRGLAALYIVFHHAVHFCLTDPRPKRFLVFGQAAVMLFFIMSGFVIYYASFGRGGRPRFGDYFRRRFLRIYPLFVAALVVSYLVECANAGALLRPDLPALVGNLLMLQDNERPGNWFGPFYGNEPLWSLSYEWFFYMAFFPVAVLLMARPRVQKYAVLGLSVLGFLSFRAAPNPISHFLCYFVLWWSGVELAREYVATGRVTFRGQAVSLLSVAAVTGLWLAAVLARRGMPPEVGGHPMLEFRHFATVLAMLVVGLGWYRLGGRGFQTLFGWGRHLAPISYALYAFHLPVILLVRPWLPPSMPWLIVVVAPPLAVAVAYALEQGLQPRVNRWFSPRPRPPAPAAAPVVSETAHA